MFDALRQLRAAKQHPVAIIFRRIQPKPHTVVFDVKRADHLARIFLSQTPTPVLWQNPPVAKLPDQPLAEPGDAIAKGLVEVKRRISAHRRLPFHPGLQAFLPLPHR